MEFDLKAYLVPMNALRMSKPHPDVDAIIEVYCFAKISISRSREMARAEAMAEALERWPPSDGYFGHNVDLQPFTQKNALEILQAFPDLAPHSDFSELSEMVM
jgi:hypothetical protein